MDLASNDEHRAASPGHLVVIGASMGGVEALLELAAALPADFAAPIAVVLHIGSHPSILPELLARAGPLRAVHATSGERLRPGTIYVAPPDHHMVLDDGKVRLSRGPRENHARPAIDPLFRSAALAWGPRAIGVVLTGELDDGTAGLEAIKVCGGTTVVQDPGDAVASSMPASALAHVEIDHCVALSDCASLLIRLASAPAPAVPQGEQAPIALVREQAIFNGEASMDKLTEIAIPSQLTCPECGGSLSELKDSRPLRYRCHTGHGYTAKSLASAQAEQTDHALQASLRALKEREHLLLRLATVAKNIGDAEQARAGQQQAARVHEQAQQLARLMEEEAGGA